MPIEFDIAAARADIESTEGLSMTITWEEFLASTPVKRAILKKHGLDKPSRRKVSYNTSERFMRKAFGGERVPQWALHKEAKMESIL